MARRASEYFDHLGKTAYDSRLKGLKGTVRFDLEKAGTWVLTVDDGKVRVEPGSADADCVFACGEEDFLLMVAGKQNLLTAALQGRVRVFGDLALAKVFHGCIRNHDQIAEPSLR